MTVKSSEVLRLAAEKALSWPKGMLVPTPMMNARIDLHYWEPIQVIYDVEYYLAQTNEEECMALCLAAAIAEEEGD